MFSQTDIQNYRNIKAPIELREKVLSASENSVTKKYFSLKTISSLAACLLIGIFCVFWFNNLNSPVTITPILPANNYPRGVESVLLVVECDGKMDVSSTDNTFYYFSEDSDEAECLTELKNVNNKLEIQWKVSGSPSFLRVNGELFEVSYSFSDEKIVISKVKK
jgi:hypothetical protein